MSDRTEDSIMASGIDRSIRRIPRSRRENGGHPFTGYSRAKPPESPRSNELLDCSKGISAVSRGKMRQMPSREGSRFLALGSQGFCW